MEFIVGILLIVLGFAAIGLPFATSIAVVFVLIWTLIVAGFAHLFTAMRGRTFGGIAMGAIIGIAYFVSAVAIQRHPLWGLASLALVVSAALVVEGVTAIVAYFTIGREGGASLWLLLNGAVTLVLGFVVWNLATTSPAVLVSALVGVNLIAGGTARILTAIATERLRRAVEL